MADKESVYGVKYEVDIEELKSSTAQAKKSIQLANAEFKKSSSAMDNWAASTDGVSAKIKQLNTVLEAQKTKLANLKNDYNSNVDSVRKYADEIDDLKAQKQSAIEQYGKESEKVQELNKQIAEAERKQQASMNAAEKLNIAIMNQESAINKTQKEVGKYTQKLNELQEENAQSESAMNKLKSTISEQESELKSLKNEYANVVLEQGKSSEEAQQLASRIRALNGNLNQNKSALNEVENETNQLTSAMQEVGDSADKAGNAMDKLKSTISTQESELQSLKNEYASVVLEQGKSANEAEQLAGRIKELNGSLNQNKSRLNEVESEAEQLADSLEKTGDSAEKAEDGFTIMKGAIADLTANAITAAISKVGEFAGSLFELSDATAEYRQMTAKLEGSANTFGYSIDFAKEKYKELYGYLKDDQMAVNAITNLMGIGASTETVSSIVDSAIGVWSAYGDSIPIESLTESINETAQVGKVTGSLADALNWAGISEDAFNEKLEQTNDTKARAELIAKTLNDRYGESKQTYDELTGSMTEANEAELELKETQARLGEAVEPVNTAFTNLKTKALDKLAPTVDVIAGKLEGMLNYLVEHPAALEAVSSAIMGVVAVLATLATAMGIKKLIDGVKKSFDLLKVSMAANPFGIVALALAGLAAAFMTLWKTSDEFRGKITDTINQIKESFAGFGDEFVSKINELGFDFSSFTEMMSAAWKSFCDILAPIFTGTFELIASTVDMVLNQILALTDIFVGVFTGDWEQAFNGILDLFTNLIDGFTEKIGTLVGMIGEVGATILEKLGFEEAAEKFRQFFTILSEGIQSIPEMLAALVEMIAIFFTETIPTALTNFATTITTFFTVTIPTTIYNFIVLIQTSIATFVTNVKTSFFDLVTNIQTLFANLWTGIVEFFTATIPAWIANVISFFQQIPYYIGYMVGFIIGKFAEWGMNLVNFVTVDIPNFINTAVQWFRQLPTKIKEFLTDVIARTTEWVRTMIQKATEAGSNFISRTVEFFSQLPGRVWDFLSNAIGKAGQFVSDMASKASQAGQQFLNNVTNFIQSLPGRVWGFLSDTISRAASFASDLAQKGMQAGRDLVNNITSTISNLPGEMLSIGSNIVSGLWNGISGAADWIYDKVRSFASGILDGIEGVLRINSPSKEAYYLGEMFDAGFGNAIEDGTKAVVKKAGRMATGVLSKVKDNLKEKVQVGFEVAGNLKNSTKNAISKIALPESRELAYAGNTQNVNNITFKQYNTSPKALDSLEVYRNTKKQLKQLKAWKGR